jgi:hypothetical protein
VPIWDDPFVVRFGGTPSESITTEDGFPAQGNTVTFFAAYPYWGRGGGGGGQQLASDIDNARHVPGGAIEVNNLQGLQRYYDAGAIAALQKAMSPLESKPKPIEEVEEVPGRKARLVNKFLIGCDPEFVTIHNGRRCDVGTHLPREGVVGWDHGGRIAEIRPNPSRGVYRLIKTIQKVLLEEPTLQTLVHRRWRAGALYADGNTIETLGGHIHIDVPWDKKTEPVKALDLLTRKLEALDILPKNESAQRRGRGGYGMYGDARAVATMDGNRIEYRTMASWLFSPAIAFVCLAGAKLAAHSPDSTLVALKGPASYKQLIKFFELFQGKDDNADRALERVLDKGNLKADPDADVRKAWERLGF